MYGKIKLGSGEAIPVSSLDNEDKYIYTMDSYSVSAQKAVPVFKPAGKSKGIGSSDTTIGYQMGLDDEKGKKPRLDEMEGNIEADDLGYGGDKIAILADALQVAWGMGKSNSQIDFTDMARRTMGELENELNEALFLYSDEEMKKGASPKEYTDKEIDNMSLEAAKKLYKDAKNNWNVPHNHKLAKRLQAKIDKENSKK